MSFDFDRSTISLLHYCRKSFASWDTRSFSNITTHNRHRIAATAEDSTGCRNNSHKIEGSLAVMMAAAASWSDHSVAHRIRWFSSDSIEDSSSGMLL